MCPKTLRMRDAPTNHKVPTMLGSSSRIPADLQAVFVASNKGGQVDKPPASKSAFKVFLSFSNTLQRLRGRRRSSVHQRSLSITSSSCTHFPSSESSLFHTPSGALEIQECDLQSCPPPILSPQQWVEDLFLRRGYSTKRHNTVQTAYFNKPTQLQLASYNARSVELCTNVKYEKQLRQLLTCGISLNACNIHGESLMHKACRLGLHQILKLFLELDPELKVCDAQGRTLLHDACWGARPSFQTFALLLQHEPQLLFMADYRGACPLDYVQKSHYDFWLDYLEDNAHRFWPVISEQPKEPELVNQPAHSRPIPDPSNALSCELASMVATGRMTPDEVVLLVTSMKEGAIDVNNLSSSDYDDDDGEDDSDSDDSLDEDDDSSCATDSTDRAYGDLNDQMDDELLDELESLIHSRRQ